MILDENDVPGEKLNKLPETAVGLKRWLMSNLKKMGTKSVLVQRVQDGFKRFINRFSLSDICISNGL